MPTNLTIAAAGCAALNPKGGPQARLPYARKNGLGKVRSKRLTKPDRRGALPLAQRCRVDTRDNDKLSIPRCRQALPHGQRYLCLAIAIQL